MRDRLTELLDLQRTVCSEVDVDPADLHHAALLPGNVVGQRERRDRLITWVWALCDELHEATDEVSWKRHTTGGRWDGEAAFGELRDALQFLVDLMFLATGLDAEQLADRLDEALRTKSEVNLRRAREGDDGVARRCPACKRSYDDEAVTCREGFAFTGETPVPAWCQDYGLEGDWSRVTMR